MRAQSIKTGEVFIGIYAVDSPSSFESIRELYRHIQDVKSGSYNAFPTSNRDKKSGKGRLSKHGRIPFVLVANKCDLDPKLKKISTVQGIALSRELQCPFIECSAKFGMNTSHIFETAVREVIYVNAAFCYLAWHSNPFNDSMVDHEEQKSFY